jgi:hypothetical protein
MVAFGEVKGRDKPCQGRERSGEERERETKVDHVFCHIEFGQTSY